MKNYAKFLCPLSIFLQKLNGSGFTVLLELRGKTSVNCINVESNKFHDTLRTVFFIRLSIITLVNELEHIVEPLGIVLDLYFLSSNSVINASLS